MSRSWSDDFDIKSADLDLKGFFLQKGPGGGGGGGGGGGVTRRSWSPGLFTWAFA